MHDVNVVPVCLWQFFIRALALFFVQSEGARRGFE